MSVHFGDHKVTTIKYREPFQGPSSVPPRIHINAKKQPVTPKAIRRCEKRLSERRQGYENLKVSAEARKAFRIPGSNKRG